MMQKTDRRGSICHKTGTVPGQHDGSCGRLCGGNIMNYKIGELARITGCKPVTIRYYEREGLLPAPERTAGNYRQYGEKDLERLRFIRHCRQHGMELDEIRALLAFRDKPVANCSWINGLVAEHIARVDEQIAALQHLKEHLQTLLHSCEGGQGENCGILKSLDTAGNCPHCARLASARPVQGAVQGAHIPAARKGQKTPREQNG